MQLSENIVKYDNENGPVVMTKSFRWDSHNLSLCNRMNQDFFCLPDLTKTKRQGATSFYFKIKIGYILVCVLFIVFIICLKL